MGTSGSKGRKPDEGGEDTSFAIHHMLPRPYGGTQVNDFVFVPPPEIDAVAASQPVNPGMPPLWHGSVPAPDAFKPFAPPLPGVVAPPAAPAARPPTPVVERPAEIPVAPRPASAPSPVAVEEPATTEISEQYVVEESALSSIVGPALESFDPLYALVLYLAVALGTAGVITDLETRYTLLWSIMIIMGTVLTMVDSRRKRRGITSGNLIWGAGIGFVLGLPILVVVAPGLRQASTLLFPYAKLPTLFQTLIFVAPLGETVFYRGVLQERRGIIASVIGVGFGTLLLYLPSGGDAWGAVIMISVFMTFLGGLYSYVRQRYGLAAAYVCQAILNVMILFLPRIVAAARP